MSKRRELGGKKFAYYLTIILSLSVPVPMADTANQSITGLFPAEPASKLWILQHNILDSHDQSITDGRWSNPALPLYKQALLSKFRLLPNLVMIGRQGCL